MLVWSVTASPTAAQRRVALCVPDGTAEALSSEARIELAAHSVSLVVCEEPADERIVVEASDPLARPVASLRRGAKTVRTALLREPLDVIDAREFALTLSTLLEEAPDLPDQAPSEVADEPPTAPEDEAPESEDEPTPETPAPLRRVTVNRSLRHSMSLTPEFLLIVDAQHGVVPGGGFVAGIPVRPYFQIDVTVRMAEGSQGDLMFHAVIGGTGILALVGDTTFLELSFGFVMGLWPPVESGLAVGLQGRIGFVHEFNDWFGLSASVWTTPYWNDGASTVDVAGGLSVGPRFEFEL